MACSICLDDESNDPTTTLECGHSFHTKCAMHWFRYENIHCPLCRSTEDMYAANTITEEERFRRISRRVPSRRSSFVNQTLKRYAKIDAALKDSRRRLKELRASHSSILRLERRLDARIFQLREKKDELKRRVAISDVQGVPHMRWEEREE